MGKFRLQHLATDIVDMNLPVLRTWNKDILISPYNFINKSTVLVQIAFIRELAQIKNLNRALHHPQGKVQTVGRHS